MRSPFRSESEAYHFLFLTVAAFTAIVVASLLGGPWVGVPVWLVLTAAVALLYVVPRRSPRPVRTAPAHVGGQDERRILVIAGATVLDEGLLQEVERASAGYDKQVLVVSPVLSSPVRHWASDVDGARAESERRLDESLAQLCAGGIEARGEIGDEDPLRAIEDALRTFGADEIIVVTHPEEDDVVARARERFAVPIRQVTVGSGELVL